MRTAIYLSSLGGVIGILGRIAIPIVIQTWRRLELRGQWGDEYHRHHGSH